MLTRCRESAPFRVSCVSRLAGIVALIVVAALIAPAASPAANRTGTTEDPLDQQVKSLDPTYATDLAKLAVTYDEAAGTVTVAATFYRPGTGFQISASLTRSCEDDDENTGTGSTPQLSLTATLGPARASGSATLEGYEGKSSATPVLSPDGQTVKVTFTNDEFAGRDWRCVSGSAGGIDTDRLDEVDAFYLRGWAPDERPQGCTREQAVVAGDELLLPYAGNVYPRYYSGITGWALGHFQCVDVTGDGRREMIVELRCCTGGSLSPWAIFRSNANGRWRMAYAQVRDNNRGIRRTGRTVKARIVARYEGACTSVFRDRVVRWNGSRFTSRVSRAYRRGRGC